MTDAHVDDEDRLRQVLDRLASDSAPRSGLGRIIFEGQSDDAVQAVLQAIDETILPRRLIFSSGEDGRLCCDVVERRVVALEHAGSVAAADAARLVETIEAFCADASAIYLRSEITPQAQVAGEVGLSVADLLAHSAEGVASSDVDAQIAAALSESAAYALAIIDQIADGSFDEKGQSAFCDRLRHMATASISQMGPQSTEAVGMSIWLGAPSDEVAVLRVVSARRRIWMALEPCHLRGCIEIWSAIG